MAKEPWFKFWAADYLTDPDVDRLTLEAQAVLMRMWCACWIHGSLPDDAEEIARLTHCRTHWVTQWLPHCRMLFVLRAGRLFSARMEREKARSQEGRIAAEKRWNQEHSELPNGSPNGSPNAKPNAQKARKPEGQKVIPESQSSETTSCGEPEKTSGSPPAIAGTLPLIGKKNNPQNRPITESEVAEWSELYPAVDVKQALNGMRGWLKANPTRRKTPSGINRFINRWLSDEQNKAGGNGNGQRPNGRTKAQQSQDFTLEETRAALLEVDRLSARGSGDDEGADGNAAKAAAKR